MCLGSRTEATINFLNHQLLALYENAERCTEHYVKGQKPSPEIEQGTYLFEYYGPSAGRRRAKGKNDVAHWFKFAKAPSLSFICKHEVILYFFVEEGQYRLEKKKDLKKS